MSVIIAAIARDDSVEPRIESSVDKRFCETADKEETVAEETRKEAEAKNEAEVIVECKTASYNREITQISH